MNSNPNVHITGLNYVNDVPQYSLDNWKDETVGISVGHTDYEEVGNTDVRSVPYFPSSTFSFPGFTFRCTETGMTLERTFGMSPRRRRKGD